MSLTQEELIKAVQFRNGKNFVIHNPEKAKTCSVKGLSQSFLRGMVTNNKNY